MFWAIAFRSRSYVSLSDRSALSRSEQALQPTFPKPVPILLPALDHKISSELDHPLNLIIGSPTWNGTAKANKVNADVDGDPESHIFIDRAVAVKQSFNEPDSCINVLEMLELVELGYHLAQIEGSGTPVA
jgi:hypothetical protein